MTDLILLAAILSVPASVVSLFAFPRQIARLAGFGSADDVETVVTSELALAPELTIVPEFSFSGEAAAA